MWKKDDRTFLVPRGGAFQDSERHIWMDQVYPQRTNAITFFAQHTGDGPYRATPVPCRSANSNFSRNSTQWKWVQPQLENFISWGARARTREELQEVVTSKWLEAANNAAAHLNDLGNTIDPPIFCDEEVGSHNSNCNVILYENQ